MTDSSISEEDKALFRKHVQTMKPLNKDKPESHPQKGRDGLASIKKVTYFLSDYIKETVHSETILSYSKSKILEKQLNELRKGLIPFEARLDLHGFKVEAAREALCTFIQEQTYANRNCILIIHGKGGHQGAPPVIKNHINRWLPQFEEVIAFHSALPKHGGQGAVYVLLKKEK